MDKVKLPRHKIEELRRKEDEEKTKEVYSEFISVFEGPKNKLVKTFVRGEVVNADAESSKPPPSKTRLYAPPSGASSKLDKNDTTMDAARKAAEEKARKFAEEAAKSRPEKPGKKKEDVKPKSNLEAFKEELRRMQEEREERRKLRRHLQEHMGIEKEPLDKMLPLDNPYIGTYDADPTTTNLFASNLNPKTAEEDICRLFGRFGPLASIKIMWPRTDEERNRGYLTGFVAFMTRRDAERAAATLKGKECEGHEMKLNWGKAVPIPQHPVYVPQKMLEMTLPPPPSGLPFNAQPRPEDQKTYLAKWTMPTSGSTIIDEEQQEAWQKMIRNAVVKVVIPTERPLLCLIHRMIEFVVRGGPMFEAMIMSREISSPMYRFLFDYQSPAHVYYRWKLFSILQGEPPSKWKTEEFRIFDEGSLWRPPPLNFYQQGMPVELYEENERPSNERKRERRSSRSSGSKNDDDDRKSSRTSSTSQSANSSTAQAKRYQLSDSQRKKLSDMLRNLTPEREKILETMIYCVEHADAAEEIVGMIAEGFHDNTTTSLPRIIARLYLIVDILANCAAKVMNVSYYRKFFGNRLEEIFYRVHATYSKIDARLKAEHFKQRVMLCFRAWEDTAVYTMDFLVRLQNIFFGLVTETEESKFSSGDNPPNDDIDGEPMNESSAKSFNSNEATGSGVKPLVDYDLDGVPIEEEEEMSYQLTGKKTLGENDSSKSAVAKAAFVRSKWETVEPEVVEQQAMTLSKWEQLEQEEKASASASSTVNPNINLYDDDLDGIPMDDDLADGNAQCSSSNASQRQTTGSSGCGSSKSEMSEEKRQQLREIEVKVMKYQDELESGQRSKPRDVNVQEEVEKYRQKLLRKVEEKSRHVNESEVTKTPKSTAKLVSTPSTSMSRGRTDSERSRDSKISLSSAGKKKRHSRSRSRSRSNDGKKYKHSRRSRSRSPSKYKKKKH